LSKVQGWGGNGHGKGKDLEKQPLRKKDLLFPPRTVASTG